MSRITLVVNQHGSASETFQRALASLLDAGGHEVTVHALRASDSAGATSSAVAHSVGLPPASQPGSLARELARQPPETLMAVARRARAVHGMTRQAKLAAALAAPIVATRPDVVHIGFSGIGIALGDALDLLAPTPVVVSCRGTDELVHASLEPGRPAAMLRLFEQSALVHCVADAVADAVVGLGADPDKVRVIRPAVDIARWQPRLGEPAGPPWQIVTVTRLVPQKAVEDLVSAMAILLSRGLDVRLRVIGQGPGAQSLRLRIRRLGLDDHVDLVGACSSDEVRREVAEAHMYASASLSEGISNGVLEAMASGVPVVSTEVGGMAEVLTDGRDGWLVPPARPDLLADALAEAISDGSRRAAVAAAGRARVSSAFDLESQAAAWLALYGEEPVAPRLRVAPSSQPEGKA